jgi:hypothetical protein
MFFFYEDYARLQCPDAQPNRTKELLRRFIREECCSISKEQNIVSYIISLKLNASSLYKHLLNCIDKEVQSTSS